MDKSNQIEAQADSSTTSSSPINTVEEKELTPVSQDKKTRRKKKTKSPYYIESFVERRTDLLVHLLGYSFLGFGLCDGLHIIVPPRFTDPFWEFQTMGSLVEHAAVPLLGLILVFYRRSGYISISEKKLLSFLSWAALLMGVFYLLMLPLGVANTWRIYHRNQAQITAQVSQQNQQYQQIKQRLDRAKTDTEIQQVFASLNPSGRAPQIKNPQEFKDQLLNQVSQAQHNIEIQAQNTQQNKNILLLKNSVKWNLGALIAATMLISIWHFTSWARRKSK